MLCLSRKVGERIVIGDNIILVINGIRSNGAVELGIQAPPTTRILRTELLSIEEQERIHHQIPQQK